MKKILMGVVAASFLFAGNSFHHKTYHQKVHKTQCVNTNAPLTQSEQNELIFTREEEKLARDVYLTLYKKWGLNVFKNIAKSENRHTTAIKRLLDKYKLPDPVATTGDKVGVFVNQTLQDLYYKLVEAGSKSEIDALKVGATIEDLDINDLEHAIDDSTHSDIINVYKNLEKGSRNHMRAFYKQLKLRGADYQPQYISQEYFQQIVSSDWERGRVK